MPTSPRPCVGPCLTHTVRAGRSGTHALAHPTVIMLQPDPCGYVKEFCSSLTVINYMEMHFCTFANVEWLSYIVLVRRPSPLAAAALLRVPRSAGAQYRRVPRGRRDRPGGGGVRA